MNNENIIKEAKTSGITIVDKDIVIGKVNNNSKITIDMATKALSAKDMKLSRLEIADYAYVLLKLAGDDISDAYSISFKGKSYNYVPMTMKRIAKLFIYSQGEIDLMFTYEESSDIIYTQLKEDAEKAGLNDFESESIEDIKNSKNKYIFYRTFMGVEIAKEIINNHLVTVEKSYNSLNSNEKNEIKLTFKDNLSQSKNLNFRNNFNTLGENLRKDIIAQINKGINLKFNYDKIFFDLIYVSIDLYS